MSPPDASRACLAKASSVMPISRSCCSRSYTHTHTHTHTFTTLSHQNFIKHHLKTVLFSTYHDTSDNTGRQTISRGCGKHHWCQSERHRHLEFRRQLFHSKHPLITDMMSVITFTHFGRVLFSPLSVCLSVCACLLACNSKRCICGFLLKLINI